MVKFLCTSSMISLVLFLILGIARINPYELYFAMYTIIGFTSIMILCKFGHKMGKSISKQCCGMGWHKPIAIRNIKGDPLNFQKEAECEYCGYKGLLDSHGELF